jgi:hypothetical protein
MPTLVHQNALQSVGAKAESTATTPVATAPSTATIPLTTVQPTAIAVYMIDSCKRPLPINPIIENLIQMYTRASGQPIKVSAFDLCNATGIMYKKFAV